MKLLPRAKFYLVSSLTPTEVDTRLQEHVETQQTGWGIRRLFEKQTGKPFSGYAAWGHFKFMRVIQGRNSFVPVIQGKTEAWMGGTILHATVKLESPVAIFMCLWLGGIGFACIGILVDSFSESEFSPAMLIPFAMFAFGYLMMVGIYNNEFNTAKEMLLKILPGRIEDTEDMAYKT